MKPGPTPPDRPLRAKLRELGLLSQEQEAGLPDFLILAPECAEARGLAHILQRHPACALPDSLGTRFFSFRHQWCDLDWYVRTLGNDVHLVRGEWTPSYALAPVKTIRLIQELLPQLRLVFLLGDPAVEAWRAWKASQAAGMFPGKVAGIWPWARADFLGQLRRWKSVFPAEQFFIGFDDQLNSDQGAFLKGLLEFLNVEPALLDQPGDLRPAAPEEIPALDIALLREACRSRIEELAAFLHNDFGRHAPDHWTAVPIGNVDSDKVAQMAHTFASVAKHEFDDVALFRAVEIDEGNLRCAVRPSTAPTPAPRDTESRSALFNPDKLAVRGDLVPRLVHEGYRGFNIVALRRMFIAVPQAAGELDLSQISDAELDNRVDAREFLRARSLAESEREIDVHLATTLRGVDDLPQSAA